MLRQLKLAVFPPKCTVCGNFFHSANRAENDVSGYLNLAQEVGRIFSELMSPFLCQKCCQGFVPVKSPLCIQCGVMFKSREGEDHLCAKCMKASNKIHMARAPGVYCDTLMDIIHSLKYQRNMELARPLGIFLFLFFVQTWKKNTIDIIVPVPLHALRMRKRGFNQAYLLIRQWPKLVAHCGLKGYSFQISRQVLLRHRKTISQVGLGRKERQKNIQNAFRVSDPSFINEKRVLLVDDVYTTGSTVNECAKTLLRNGAKQVDVLTLARV